MATTLDPQVFRLWLALGFRPRGQNQCDDFWAVIQSDIAQAAVADGGSFAGETLLARWLSNQPQGDTPESIFRQRVSHALLDQGLDPWEKVPGGIGSVSAQALSGFNALSNAVIVNDEALITRMLQDARRPDWLTVTTGAVLGQHGLLDLIKQGAEHVGERSPMLLRALVNSGLDPNWVHTDGNPLVFLAPDMPSARWLVDRGADLQMRNTQNEGVFAYKSRTGSLSNEALRKSWAGLVGPEHFDEEFVWRTANVGKYDKVRLIFADEQAASKWRWHPEDSPRSLSVLDAAAIGDIQRRGTNVQELAMRLTRDGIAWPVESLRLATLAAVARHRPKFQSGTPDVETWAQAQVSTLKVNKTGRATQTEQEKVAIAARKQFSLLPLTREAVLLGIDDFLALAPFAQIKEEAFRTWAQLFPEPEWREGVLDRWLTWTEQNAERWQNSSVLGWRHQSPQTDQLTFHEVVPTLTMRHQTAVLGAALVEACRLAAGGGTQDQDRQKTRILERLPDLADAQFKTAAETPQVNWTTLHQAIERTSVGTEVLAVLRQLRTAHADFTPPARTRPRVRS